MSVLYFNVFTLYEFYVLQGILVLSGVAILSLGWPQSTCFWRKVPRPSWWASSGSRAVLTDPGQYLFYTCLFVPWFILMLLTAQSRLERYWQLWPLQAVAIAACCVYLPGRLARPPWQQRLVVAQSLLVIVLILLGRPLQKAVRQWHRDGWTGPCADQILVLDRLAQLLHEQNRSEAHVGYAMPFPSFHVEFSKIDPRYKQGMYQDLYLRRTHGIENLSRSPLGITAADEYRITYVGKHISNYRGVLLAKTTDEGEFDVIATYGPLQLRKRLK